MAASRKANTKFTGVGAMENTKSDGDHVGDVLRLAHGRPPAMNAQAS
jgi:hypothetical protein